MSVRLALIVTVLAMVGSVTAGAATTPGGTFIDDDGNVHEAAIEAIRTAGVTTGCDPVGDLYCPGDSVSRAQMAAFVVRALGEPNPTPASSGTFSDVPPSAWYAPFVERLVELGITTGYTDGTFRPDALVSRAEMAAFVVRALDESPSTTPTRFSDVQAGIWYEGLVERLAELQITSGCAMSPLRYCPLDAVGRDQMASFVARAFDLPVEPVPARASVQNLVLARVQVAGGLSSPIFLDAPIGDSRLFVVEQPGRIKIIADGAVSTFLDISSKVLSGGERGLIGLAFHPDYASNGLFYVHYSRSGDGAGVIAEYQVSSDPDLADPGSERILKTVSQPAANHNGGMLAFGPDGYLYAAFGDGGGGGDPYRNGQNTSTILGSIARLDPATGNAAAGNPFGNEVYYPGVRNPWRFSIDGNRMYIADVGQDAREEINVVSLFAGGTNFGWPVTEGSACYAASSCNTAGLTDPVAEYTHSLGRSITGGYVYRGSAIPDLVGHYVYGDFVFGWVGSFRYDGTGPVDGKTWDALSTSSLASFGTDGSGEMYIVSLGGTVYKIVPG
jgi:glucose/arabinose dehydrogenase